MDLGSVHDSNCDIIHEMHNGDPETHSSIGPDVRIITRSKYHVLNQLVQGELSDYHVGQRRSPVIQCMLHSHGSEESEYIYCKHNKFFSQ